MDSQLLILGLHRVGHPPKCAKIRGLFTTPRLLEFQLRLLRFLGFRFKTLKEAIADPRGRVAVITFDDGYADNFTAALPILEKFDAPATVFVVTDDVGKKDVVWEEASEDLPADMLTWDMLSELRRKGWEIGSHAHRHIHLSRYSQADQLKAVELSMELIEKNLGNPPVSFAYPYGNYDHTTKRVLMTAGIKNAVTTNNATFQDSVGPKDQLELSRVALGGRNYRHFLRTMFRTLKLAGSFQPVKVASPAVELRIAPKSSLG